MLFSSPTFLYAFLPAVLFFYFVVLRKSRKAQNVFLLLASIFFYAWGEPTFVLVMIGSIIMNWLFGLLADKYRDDRIRGRLVIAFDVLLNLSILFVFKYLMFTLGIINKVTGAGISIPTIVLPIGVSFFTFQAMSYVIDVYRGRGKVQKNILHVGLYISLFPQLIAGPIVRYETIADQITDRHETVQGFFDGFARFIVGLAKKVLLANSFAILADAAFDRLAAGGSVSVMFGWLGAIAYTFQILFDFGGYSDMAIGLGGMFGFHFLENFDYPYISTSVTEFWRRWHMSLGSWFRDYVYIPLGGSRVKKPRLIFNLFVVWFLTGLWHGANFTFIIWGMMYFILLVFEKLTGYDKKGGRCVKALKWIITMLFVVLGWVIFRSDSVENAIGYLGSMFGLAGNSFSDGFFRGYLAQNGLLLILGVIASTPIVRWLKGKTEGKLWADILRTVFLILLFVLSVASLVSNAYNPFIYFNF